MAETKQPDTGGRVTVRGVDLAIWRRFKVEATLQQREMGGLLNEWLRDYLDYFEAERRKEANE